MEIQKVAVIGAGVMGAGIAAHIANAGLPVILLDIVPEGAENRNIIAEGAIAKLLKVQPAAFMHKRNAKRVTAGNIEDHLELLADVDWIVEAVIERLDIKQNLYKKIDAVRKPGSLVSSNTSTIPLALLTEGMPDDFCKDFMITHFFNPPRYMRLLELAGGKSTRPEALKIMADFCDQKLGKGVVSCNDTPGFIGNRVGIYWLQCAVLEAIDGGLTIEEADAVVGKPMGIPATGVFGLIDLVGLDLMPHILKSMMETLPENDAFHSVNSVPPLVEKMIETGYTGRKGKGGFYRLNREGGKKVKESINLSDGEYSTSKKPSLASVRAARKGGLRALVEYDDKTGQYAWRVLAKTLSYAASLVPEIADDIQAIDQAMKLGYNWKFGPFELIDKLGVEWFCNKLESEGMAVPELLRTAAGKPMYRVENGQLQFFCLDGGYKAVERSDGVLLLSDIKLGSKPIIKNGSASLWDIADGVVCLEFHSKMNTIDPQILGMVQKSLGIVQKDYKAMVIYNEGSNFAAGANIGLLLFAINIAAWPEIRNMVQQGQQVYKNLKQARFPIVGAPSGMALGGGCEILLHCDAIQAHAESYIGLVEVGVGLVPAWGGCKEMLYRWQSNPKHPKGPMPAVAKAFEIISTATVAKSAEEAKSLLFLGKDDDISMNRDRLLADAKAKALSLVEGYSPPEPYEYRLPGLSAKVAMEMAVDGFHKSGKATDYDVVVSNELASVLSGGNTDMSETMSEDDLLALERQHFVKLARQSGTIDRIEQMLEKGKPLRN
ncbi:MAG: 3-hydroxyacyl-CoA dehydrogenase [Gammaproteobacteria bacterium]|nr:MAG: 3-hydroxyacyl-CoA dehydrogenase [Gammaproteobacteria bacterium]